METGWLIERRSASGPEWLMYDSSGCPDWTKYSIEALRFARKRDADSFAGDMSEEVFITEHMWG